MNLYCSYYTKSRYITQYMLDRLSLAPGQLVFEPSAGDGVFIDEILEKEPSVRIVAYDLNPEAIGILGKKYRGLENIKLRQADTLLDSTLDQLARKGGVFDRIIGNPPYGAWQDYDKRKVLKEKYQGFYVKETYALFLLRCVSVLKKGGILTFIVPDTFLFLHRHTSLRRFLLQNTELQEILIIPSKFFPGVSFGYSNLCIITLKKSESVDTALNNEVTTIEGLIEESQMDDIRLRKNLGDFSVETIKQNEILKSASSAFLIKSDARIRNLINHPTCTVGDIAYCVTGIYTGDNRRFIRVSSKTVRGSKDYDVVPADRINYEHRSLEGISGHNCFIPLTKGTSENKYLREGFSWYIDWSVAAVEHYKTDPKARFQNPQFYFQRGIALPMVKSRRISATLMDNSVFDQSIVGVFPKDERLLHYLLGFLNSQIARTILLTINPTANNSANYVKKMPIVIPPIDVLEEVDELVKDIFERVRKKQSIDAIQTELDGIFEDIFEQEPMGPAKGLLIPRRMSKGPESTLGPLPLPFH